MINDLGKLDGIRLLEVDMEHEATEALELLEELGFEWASGHSPTSYRNWIESGKGYLYLREEYSTITYGGTDVGDRTNVITVDELKDFVEDNRINLRKFFYVLAYTEEEFNDIIKALEKEDFKWDGDDLWVMDGEGRCFDDYDSNTVFRIDYVTKTVETYPKFFLHEGIYIYIVDQLDQIISTMTGEKSFIHLDPVKIEWWMLFKESQEVDVDLEDSISLDEMFDILLSDVVHLDEPSTESQELIDEHRELIEHLHQVYINKNSDYGNSFGKSYERLGIISAVTRIGDKYNRIEELALSNEQRVDDESLIDSCEDLANYAIMLAMELKREDKQEPRVF